LFYSSIGKLYVFAILQHILSDYLHGELRNGPYNELSAEIMDLLFALIKFGFYHTKDHLVDVIRPIVEVTFSLSSDYIVSYSLN
jgi:hypothetical protein